MHKALSNFTAQELILADDSNYLCIYSNAYGSWRATQHWCDVQDE